MGHTTINIYEARTQLSRMIDRAAAGEEIVISRNGRPVARLCPLESSGRVSAKFGVLKGRIEVAPDFDAPLPDGEAAIKTGSGKSQVDVRQLAAAVDMSGFLELYVTAEHAALAAELPPHHRDPFDRLLIAQAMTEPLVLLTADDSLAQYSEPVRLV